jgi:hypothetical protein
MSGPPDLDALARRYLDLWQEQMAAAASDPALSDLFGRTMQVMASGFPLGLMALWNQAGMQPAATSERDTANGDTPSAAAPSADEAARRAAPGPAPAAPAPEPRGGDVVQRDDRLAALEERIARLEARLAVAQGGGGKGAGAARGTRKRRS